MKPRLLDLFCGAGGSAKGYQRSGFYVVGVDTKPQPNYCGDEFIRDDALDYLRWILADDTETPPSWYFDAIHASPPCQAYSRATAWRGNRADHIDLIGPTRDLLVATDLPYVIENVQEARSQLCNPLMLCGSALGLPIRRHRYFEANWPLSILTYPCRHTADDYSFDHGLKQPESAYRDAMGCEWMTVVESRQAIPPAYTELIGHQLMQHVLTEAAA